ncbi:MAG: hypothetical protein JXJ20_07675 [Anaerolineae bacterium]|nr:hypothetical protein [Anaerolineae bacterium]
MHSRTSLSRLMLVVAVVILAALACNLERKSGEDTTPTPSAQRPIVEIIEPAEGASVAPGQNVSVRARATGASGITLIELRANNLVVDSQVPAEEISPNALEVLLDYKAENPGSVVLSVTAYSNNIAGQPALRTVNVVDELDAGEGGSGTPFTALPPTPTQYNPLCRARVNVGLNFRTGPGTEYDKILTFAAGQEPPITGYADRSDGRWWQVSWGGQAGWIKESYTTQLGDCSAVRPVDVPPSPTPIPSDTPPPTEPGETPTPTLPDLRLSALEGPLAIDLGDDGTTTAIYTIRVINVGGQPSGQFNVGIALPTGEIKDLGLVASLDPNQSVQIPSGGLEVVFDSPGIKRLLVTVDVNNVVTESDEANNQAYLDITVTGEAEDNTTDESGGRQDS